MALLFGLPFWHYDYTVLIGLYDRVGVGTQTDGHLSSSYSTSLLPAAVLSASQGASEVVRRLQKEPYKKQANPPPHAKLTELCSCKRGKAKIICYPCYSRTTSQAPRCKLNLATMRCLRWKLHFFSSLSGAGCLSRFSYEPGKIGENV